MLLDKEKKDCKELFKGLYNGGIEKIGCEGPGGLNKSLMVVADINITLGMVVAVAATYYYCTNILNKPKGGT
tara:strand:+ start:4090 stop:4305 length:216 start_codon:yes stop_codon:yes gene_type:complete